MLILQDEVTGEPVVVQLAAPRTVIAVDDTSEHHLTLAIGEHSATKLRLVMANHIAAAMARAVVEQLGRRRVLRDDEPRDSQRGTLRSVT